VPHGPAAAVAVFRTLEGRPLADDAVHGGGLRGIAGLMGTTPMVDYSGAERYSPTHRQKTAAGTILSSRPLSFITLKSCFDTL